MRFRNVIGAGSLALFATSCSLGDPVDAGSVNVFVEVNDSQITVGQDTVTVTVSVRNVGYDVVTLSGQSDCLLYVEVFNSQGTLVWNSNTSCTGASVTETIAAGQGKSQAVRWNGTNSAGAALATGYYLVRGVARTSEGARIGLPLTVAVD